MKKEELIFLVDQVIKKESIYASKKEIIQKLTSLRIDISDDLELINDVINTVYQSLLEPIVEDYIISYCDCCSRNDVKMAIYLDYATINSDLSNVISSTFDNVLNKLVSGGFIEIDRFGYILIKKGRSKK